MQIKNHINFTEAWNFMQPRHSEQSTIHRKTKQLWIKIKSPKAFKMKNFQNNWIITEHILNSL